jgi:hypothetical protein
MVARCHRPKNKDYEFYGARGITVCDAWRESFESFLADMGDPPKGMTLERQDNDSEYSAENCRWASRRVQSNNTRHNVIIKTGQRTMTMSQFASFVGLHYANVRSKINRGIRSINDIQIEVIKKGEVV